jgi:hypothetical protein
VLFNTLGAPMASTPPPGCTVSPDPNNPNGVICPANPVPTSTPQPAGLVTMQHTPNLIAALPSSLAVTCPTSTANGGFPYSAASNGNCKQVSLPLLSNNFIWQNRAFHIEVGPLGAGNLSQQSVVTLVPALNQPSTGFCALIGTANGAPGSGGAVNYWDIGVRGDSSVSTHSSGFTLTPTRSILTSLTGGYNNNNNLAPAAADFIAQYCNGSRLPPENGGHGFNVPPGHSESTGLYPIFALNSITPAATVDEGNNWINLGYGPLSLVNPVDAHTVLGNYSIAGNSPAINAGTNTGAPDHDFFGNTRARTPINPVDIGAVEFQGALLASASVTPGSLSFTNVTVGTSSAAQTLTLHNAGPGDLTINSIVVSGTGFSRPAGVAGGSCAGTLTAAVGTCTINVVFSPGATGAAAGTVTITANSAVSGSPVSLTCTGVAAAPSATLTPTSRDFGTVTRGSVLGPVQVFTLRNTGNTTLTGISQGSLGGANATEFTIIRLASTCGPAGGGQLLGQTTLAPNATCVVTVQFRPQTAQTTGAKTATVSVTDVAGTQSSTLTGTAQ